MKAKTDIGYCMPFYVPGVNFTNPVTYEDSGHPAVFAATQPVKAGEEVTAYSPRAVAVGMYMNVTRELTADDEAIEGWPPKNSQVDLSR